MNRTSILHTLLAVAAMVHSAGAVNSYTALQMQVSSDGRQWGRDVTVAPGGTVQARIIASYEGMQTPYGLAWVNFQPIIKGVSGFDTLADYVSTGSMFNGQVAYDKPETGQAAYGRVYPFAATELGIVPGGQNTTLTRHDALLNGQNTWRIAQARTTNPIGNGPTSGQFAYNNTNGAGGIVCAQPPAELTSYQGERSTETSNVVLFTFAITFNTFTTQRNITFDLPEGGVSRFGQGFAAAGWFSTPELSGNDVTYVPVRTRAATVQVRGPIPAPGGVVVLGIACWPVCVRRRRPV